MVLILNVCNHLIFSELFYRKACLGLITVFLLKKKISKVIGILYCLKNTFPLEVLITLYKSLVLSYIYYGLLLWGVEVKNLEIIQKRAIRLRTGSNYIAHTEPLFIQLGLLKV